MNETIVAISTPPINGAIGILRISGLNSRKILEKYFFPLTKDEIKPRYANYGEFKINNEKLDSGLAFLFKGPKSYTGEDLVEFHLHGSYFLLETLKSEIINSTLAREAEPGEFTRRGFENGKISLTDAEAIDRLIKAETEMQIKIANTASKGKLNKVTKDLRKSLLELNASVEAIIEYPEDTDDSNIYKKIWEKLVKHKIIIENLLNNFYKVQKIFNGVKVVIAGKPNAGKSSLLNYLAGHDRVIVTDIPGTTTDTIEVTLNLDGFKVNFVDTAGLRSSNNLIEKEGIKKAENELATADLILLLKDVNDKENFDFNFKTANVITLFSKCDLYKKRDKNYFYISSKTGEGIDRLKKIILDNLKSIDLSYGVVLTSRQNNGLKRAFDKLNTIITLVENNEMLEIISSEISEAIWYLETIIGIVTSDDVLDKMFKEFCLGK